MPSGGWFREPRLPRHHHHHHPHPRHTQHQHQHHPLICSHVPFCSHTTHLHLTLSRRNAGPNNYMSRGSGGGGGGQDRKSIMMRGNGRPSSSSSNKDYRALLSAGDREETRAAGSGGGGGSGSGRSHKNISYRREGDEEERDSRRAFMDHKGRVEEKRLCRTAVVFEPSPSFILPHLFCCCACLGPLLDPPLTIHFHDAYDRRPRRPRPRTERG